jgi:cytochrome c peroxidase
MRHILQTLTRTALMGTLCAPLALATPSVELGDDSLRISLGQQIFNDERLSTPTGQSCNSCHQAATYFSSPGDAVSPGATKTLLGNRNTPSIAYAKFSPERYWDRDKARWIGGFFLDGRAATLAEQAADALLSPTAMGNRSKAQVVAKIRYAPYSRTLEQIHGKTIWQSVDAVFNALIDAIVAFESGPAFALFSSKYDAYLRGEIPLSAQERWGLELFEAQNKGNCASCHPSAPGNNGEPPLLTNFSYHNLGLPSNSALPSLTMPADHNPQGKEYTDPGLGGNPHIDQPAAQLGKFKVPTLRNIAKTAPYMHSGMLNTLEEVLDFYNSRDIKHQWGTPEVTAHVNRDALGDLRLSNDEIQAIITYLNTLTDGYQPQTTNDIAPSADK